MPKSKISPEEFVKVWQSATTLADVTKKTALNARSAASRAHGYRKKGVPLKRLASNRPRLDINALAALAKSSAPKGAVTVAPKTAKK